MDSFYAFKFKHFLNTRHRVTFGNTILKLFLKHPVYEDHLWQKHVIGLRVFIQNKNVS
jgi:hypothetical protein